MGHGAVIRVEDFTQDLEVEISVSHKDKWMIVGEDENGKKNGVEKEDAREEIEKFEVGGKKPVATATAAAPAGESNDGAAAAASKESAAQPEEDSDDDDIEVIDAEDLPQNGDTDSKMPANGDISNGSKKRSLDEDVSGNETKKAKLDNDAKGDDDIEVIELD